MTLLITGGTGFLGRRVIAELLRRGHRAVCHVRSADRAAEIEAYVPRHAVSAVEIVTGPLTDPASCRGMVAACDGVVHLAARLAGSTSMLFMTTVVGTRTLIEAAADRGVRRFVLVSSLGVYGTQPLPARGVLDESCPIDPRPHLRDAYTFSKIEQERVAWEARDLPLVVIRPGVLFGPGRSVLSGRIGVRLGPLMVQMGGRRTAPYTYVENCASAIALAVDAPGIEGRAFNVVDDGLPTVRELFRAYRDRVSHVPAVTVPQWAVRPLAGMCEWYCRRSRGQFPLVITRYRSSAQWKPLRYSNARAKQELGWQPTVPFAEALERTIAALRDDAAAPGRC